MDKDDMLNNKKWQKWYKKFMQRVPVLRAEQAELRSSIRYKLCNKCNTRKHISKMKKKKRTRKDGTSYTSYASVCKECHSAESKEYRKNNPDKVKLYNKRPDVKSRNAYYASLRERHILRAQPKWLSKDDKQAIRDIYDLMRDCRAVTGESYHVDHIVPLNGKNVCGLHVPWNLQVLPSDINMKKSNKLA